MTPVAMMVVWVCVSCHAHTTHITSIDTTMRECLRLSRQIAVENSIDRRSHFGGWLAASAVCWRKP